MFARNWGCGSCLAIHTVVCPVQAGVAAEFKHHSAMMMEAIAIPNPGQISWKSSGTPTSSCQLSKWVAWYQSPSSGLQRRRLPPSLTVTSQMSASCEQYRENESTKLSAAGEWESLLGQLRSRALRSTSPETSLKEGLWVKLICGASFEDLAEVRNLSLVYTLAGVDCIDCAADTAVVAAVVEGVNAAKDMLRNFEFRRPWIMISVNDDVDPHFRKAEFDSIHCPSDCPRPCERVCPALAIKFQEPTGEISAAPLDGGVIMERCYGCGRCLSVCPLGLISASTYVRPIEAVSNLIMSTEVDAIEIHTGVGRTEAFRSLVSKLGHTLASLKLVAVSVPDLGEAMIPTMVAMYASMQPFLKRLNLWQLDGRPMSGDIGVGATRAVVALAGRVVLSADRPQGYLQLAGGTNAYTAISMKEKGLCGPSKPLKLDSKGGMNIQAGPTQFQGHSTGEAIIAGVAFGGYARKVVSKYLQLLHDNHRGDDSETNHNRLLLEQYPSLLIGALREAIAVVDTVKHVNNR